MAGQDDVAAQLDAVLSVIREVIGPITVGAYLYGSAVAGGLRADSDLDVFTVVSRRLSLDEKRRLVDGLTPVSWRRLRPPGWRPVELTVVVQSEVRPWRYPPRFDFQYGEWLRSGFDRGDLQPWPPVNPDVAVLISMVRLAGRALVGPAPGDVLDPVPHADLVRAMNDDLDSLKADLDDDTRNVLLTLARMWSTIVTGEMRSKDQAANWALERLPDEHRPVLELARDAYLHGGDDWTSLLPAADAAAGYQVNAIRSGIGRQDRA
jgi:streptomycin 3"-adenylyltransferase